MAVTATSPSTTSPPPKNIQLDTSIKPILLSSSEDVPKNNRRLCENCKRTYHRNSLRRHQLLCYKTTSLTTKNLKNNADEIPDLAEINNNNNNNHGNKNDDDTSSSLEQSPSKRLCLRSAVEASKVVAGLKNGVQVALSNTTVEKSPSKSKSTTANNSGNNNNSDGDYDDADNGKRVLRSSTMTAISPTKTTSMEKKEFSNANQLSNSNVNEKSKNKSNGLVCLLCNCKIKDNLEAHFNANHKLDVNSKKHYHCMICDKKFTQFDNFMHWYHYKEHHTEEKNYKCNQCSLVFSFVQTLLFHKSVDHLKEMCKSKYCERKKKVEGQQTINNNNNKNYHLGDRDRDSSYQSSSDMSCSASTSSSSPRSSIDSPSTVSSYYDSDTKSPKSDIDNNNLQYMFKVKTKCPKDEMMFDAAQELLEHCRECHVWTKENLLDPEYEPEFWCPHCGLSFVTPTTLIKHLKTSHEDVICNVNFYMEKLGYLERPLLEHQCPVCYEVLKSSDEYNFHRRVHGLSYLSFLKASSTS